MAPETPTSELLSGWGRTAPTRATVYRPHALDEVVARVTGASSRGVVARGLGRSYGDAAQNAGGDVVLCTDLNRVVDVDLDKGTVTAEAGVSLDTLLRVLLPLGWTVMTVPGTSYVTVGGAIASDIHGKFRHGSFADFVESMRVVTPAHGPMTLTPDGTPDAFWATAGGMGLTGIVTEATLRLHPVESSYIVCDTERVANVDDCMARMMENDHEYRYSVAWIDCMATGAALGRSVLSRGNHATLDEMPNKLRPNSRIYAPSTLLGAPPVMPNVINKLSVRAFNEMWFRKAPKARHGHVEGIKPFFFPLDGIRGWNKAYGPGGFVQYQFVMPYGAEHVVRTALERFSAARLPTFLAVLKRFEHDSQAMLGFPISGWTLALDVPTGVPDLAALLDDLDEIVADAGGRVYFTKDARLRPELVGAMYPRLAEWRESRAALDPDGRLRSDLDRRLDLSGTEEW
jgi:decaprenylphospho-beta-D-ribofuranose 2-oxidase